MVSKLGVELILVALFCLMSVGFIITYVVAVHNNHVTPYFPYISETGSEPPESCIFSFVCSIGAILVLAITYIRHKHVHEYYKESPAKVTCLNTFASILGVISVIGLLLVGSFQDDKVLAVHMIGAAMVFGFGTSYEWVQLLVSSRIYRSNLSRSIDGGKCILIFRLVLASISTACFFFTSAVLIHNLSNKHYGDSHFWLKKEDGYVLHILSTTAEWLMALTFLLYFLTFHMGFTRISVSVSIKARSHHHHSSDMYGTINEKEPLL